MKFLRNPFPQTFDQVRENFEQLEHVVMNGLVAFTSNVFGIRLWIDDSVSPNVLKLQAKRRTTIGSENWTTLDQWSLPQ